MNPTAEPISLQQQFRPINQSNPLLYTSNEHCQSIDHLALPMTSEIGPQASQSQLQNGANQQAKLSRLLSKKALRMKELLLQNIGKADKSTDSLFTIYEDNFYKQQAQASRLQKEFKVYLKALKGAHEAEKSLYSCIQQVTGDYQSARHDLVCENLTEQDQLNCELMDKLRSQILVNLSDFMSQFHELKEKIAKRRRKQIDFDSSKRIYEHTLAEVNRKRLETQQNQSDCQQDHSQSQLQSQQQQQRHSSRESGSRLGIGLKSSILFGGSMATTAGQSALESATSQLIDEARLLKLREQHNYCKIMYESINGELCDELPLLYERKMKHLLMTLQAYFTLESHFHAKTSKLLSAAGDVIDELPMSLMARTVSTSPSSGTIQQAERNLNDKMASSNTSGIESSGNSSGGNTSPDSSASIVEHSIGSNNIDSVDQLDDDEIIANSDEQPDEDTVQLDRYELDNSKHLEPSVSEADENLENVEAGAAPKLAQIPTGNSADSYVAIVSDTKPSGDLESVCAIVLHEQGSLEASGQENKIHVEEETAKSAIGAELTKDPLNLYKVKTNYKYLAEDLDELCFEADEIIQVIQFDESHEPEEGWLLGIREVNGQKGLFPANFTRPI